MEVDWRAVEHQPKSVAAFAETSERLRRVRADMEKVLEVLLPGEQLPYALAGFVPDTGAAVAEYAQAYGVGAAARVRQLLFDALWLHSLDLDDAQVVHTIVVDAIWGDACSSEPSAERTYDVGAAFADGTDEARRHTGKWAEEWHDIGRETVPVVVVDDADRFIGIDAVKRLGTELLLNREMIRTSGSTSAKPSKPGTPLVGG
jgi:hypothetical protein